MKIGDEYEDGIIVEYDAISGKGLLLYKDFKVDMMRLPTKKELDRIYSLGYISDQYKYATSTVKFFGRLFHTFGCISKKVYDRLDISFIMVKDFAYYGKVYCDECIHYTGQEYCGNPKERLTPESPISRKTLDYERCTTKNEHNDCKDYFPESNKTNVGMITKIYNCFHT